MSGWRIAALGLALLATAACEKRVPPPHAGLPTEQARSMARMLADVDALRYYVAGSAAAGDAQQAAADLAYWSGRMAELFPPGQASRQYVDMTDEMVRAAPAAMQQTTQAVIAALGTGDRAAVGDQVALLERNGCGACHRRPYR
jgi:hypothetical protein